MRRTARIVFVTLFAVVVLIAAAGGWIIWRNASQALHVALVRDATAPGIFVEVVGSTGGYLCVFSQTNYLWSGGVSVHSNRPPPLAPGTCQFYVSQQPQVMRLDLRSVFDAELLARSQVCVRIDYRNMNDDTVHSKIACE